MTSKINLQFAIPLGYQTRIVVPTTGGMDKPKSNSLLLIGANVRAAAASAAFVDGLNTVSIDLFGDSDTRELTKVYKVSDLSKSGLGSVDLARLPNDYVVTGGMENRLEFIEFLNQKKNIIGCSVDSMRAAKDPFQLLSLCKRREMNFPEIMHAGIPNEIAGKGKWLIKPYLSAGGIGIRTAGKELFKIQQTNGTRQHSYLQKQIVGDSYSSVFCSNGIKTIFVGTTIQLVGIEPFIGTADDFRYCGSVGPINFNETLQQEIKRIGRLLAVELNLKGVFGVDWILDQDENLWLIEVNPRLPASFEIFERVGVCSSVLELHLHGCKGLCFTELNRENSISGKAIVFNHQFPVAFASAAMQDVIRSNADSNFPHFADIPEENETIMASRPIITVFAEGSDAGEVLSELQCRAKSIHARMKKLETIASS